MEQKSILTERQKFLLKIISENTLITDSFYLGGGTALVEFYLQHRYSEDLDFFSENEVDPQAVSVFLHSIKETIGMKKFDFQQSFNRNLFFLHFADEIIKTEFTYYPFPRIESTKKLGTLQIDSLIDIATNKLFTIYQNPRSCDYIDLYCIIQKTGFTLDDLIQKAQAKFIWNIDYLQLGSQFLRCTELKDYPRMIQDIDEKKWQDYFLEQAKLFEKKILEK